MYTEPIESLGFLGLFAMFAVMFGIVLSLVLISLFA